LSLLYYGEYHEHEWQFVRRFLKLSHVVVDAGANLGTFTVPFAKAVGPYGKVISFEPQPVIFDCLQNTVALNKLENVQLHRACLGNAPGNVEIFEPDYSQPANFSGVSFADEGPGDVQYSQKKISAPVLTLDSVLQNQRLDFLKIDVEGMELEVLQGAQEALKKHQPVIYLENNRKPKSPAIIRLLQEQGYRLWWHTGAIFNPHNFAKCAENIYGGLHNINMVCLPQSVDTGFIPVSMRPVMGPDDHIILAPGKVIPSFASDVTGL
jgi:FkbM family methyltransferase